MSRSLQQLTTHRNADFIKNSWISAVHLKTQNPNILGGRYMWMNHFALMWSIIYWNFKGSEIIKPLSFLGAACKTQDNKHAEKRGVFTPSSFQTGLQPPHQLSHPWKQRSLTGPQSCHKGIFWTTNIHWPNTRPDLLTQHLKANGIARMYGCHSPPSKLGQHHVCCQGASKVMTQTFFFKVYPVWNGRNYFTLFYRYEKQTGNNLLILKIHW